MEDFPFEEEGVPFTPNALLVIASDGIPEAMNQHAEQFGEQRLAAFIREHRHLSAAGLIDAIIGAVQSHTSGAVQSDDMTIVVVKRKQQES